MCAGDEDLHGLENNNFPCLYLIESVSCHPNLFVQYNSHVGYIIYYEETRTYSYNKIPVLDLLVIKKRLIRRYLL